jgi:hypothetical protein
MKHEDYYMNGHRGNRRNVICQDSILHATGSCLLFLPVCLKNSLTGTYRASRFLANQKLCGCFMPVLYRVSDNCPRSAGTAPSFRRENHASFHTLSQPLFHTSFHTSFQPLFQYAASKASLLPAVRQAYCRQ